MRSVDCFRTEAGDVEGLASAVDEVGRAGVVGGGVEAELERLLRADGDRIEEVGLGKTRGPILRSSLRRF